MHKLFARRFGGLAYVEMNKQIPCPHGTYHLLLSNTIGGKKAFFQLPSENIPQGCPTQMAGKQNFNSLFPK